MVLEIDFLYFISLSLSQKRKKGDWCLAVKKRVSTKKRLSKKRPKNSSSNKITTYLTTNHTFISSLFIVAIILVALSLFYFSSDHLTGAAISISVEATSISCGDVSSDLTLTGDVNNTDNKGAGIGNCFISQADHITLDCNGFEINYSGGGVQGNHAVYVNTTNFTVKNCIINETEANSGHGIFLEDADGSLLINNTIYVGASTQSSSSYGIRVATSLNSETTNHSIINNTIFMSEGGEISNYAIELKTAVNNTNLINNTFQLISEGILNSGTNVNITGNSFFGGTNGSNSITLGGGDNTSIHANTFNATLNLPLKISNTHNNTITDDNLILGLPLIHNQSIRNQVVFQDVDLNNTYGFIICEDCENVTYSNISMSGDGIYFSNVSGSVIEDSNFTVSHGPGIYISYSNDITVKNTFVNATTDTFEAVTIDNGDIFNFTNNSFYSNGVGSDSFYITTLTKSVINNNTLRTYGVTSSGINIVGANSNAGDDVNLTDNDIFTLDRTSPGVTTSNCAGCRFTGGIINSSTGNQIEDVSNSETVVTTFVNATFNSSNMSFSGSSAGFIRISEFVGVYVNNTSGNSLSGVLLTSYNLSAGVEDNVTTGSDGYISSLLEAIEFEQNVNGIYYQTPHEINATKAGYVTSNTTFNATLSGSTGLVFTLTALPPYNFTLTPTSTSQTINNNTNATYYFLITNYGLQTDSYSLSVINTNSSDVASVNTSSISNLANGQSYNASVTVGSGVPGTYNVTVNIISQGNTSVNLSATLVTTISATPANLSISLITPTSNTNFRQNKSTVFSVNVTCSNADCGSVNVSLDPFLAAVSGCNPDANDCTSTCDDLFGSYTDTNWEDLGEEQGCQGDTGSGIIYDDAGCDSSSLGAGTGECGFFDDGVDDVYECPSYERNGNTAVTVGDCICTEYDFSCATGAASIFDLTHEFFAGSSGSEDSNLKSGLITNNSSAVPFFQNGSNPTTITLNSGETQTINWYVNTSGLSGTTHVFYADVNLTTNFSVGARTSELNITIGNTSGSTDCFSNSGNQANCIAAGCTYDPFTLICLPNVDSFGCDTFCDICLTEPECEGSSKTCAWEDTDYGSFCHEDYDNFNFGGGGSLSDGDWTDVIPPDCINNPEQCDSSFDATHNFVSGESLCFDEVDNDLDGDIDCADSDCFFFPECQGAYDATTDTTAPQVKNIITTADFDATSVSFVTNEPTNTSVLFYNLNTTCNNTNATIEKFDDPFTTLDDFDLYHFFFIDQNSISSTLPTSSTLFYKINVTDQANNTYLSACLNFTTESSAKTFKFNFTGTHADTLQFDFGGGFSDYDDGAGVSRSLTKGATMRFTAFNVDFHGIDIAQSNTFDLDNAFATGSAAGFNGKEYFSMNSSTWQQLVQQMGVDNFTMSLKASNCLLIQRCNDNASICSDVTDQVTCTLHNDTHVNVTVLASLGFSSYIAGTNGQLNITDDTDTATKNPGNTVNFYANYTDISDNLTLDITNNNTLCLITLDESGANNTNMSYNRSGDERWNYTTANFSTAGTFNWTVNCTADNVDQLNLTDNVTITATTATTAAATTSTATSSSGSSLPPTKEVAVKETPKPTPADTSTPKESVSTEYVETQPEDKPVNKPKVLFGLAIFDNLGKILVDFSWLWILIVVLAGFTTLGVYAYKKEIGVKIWSSIFNGGRHWVLLAIIIIILAIGVYFLKPYFGNISALVAPISQTILSLGMWAIPAGVLLLAIISVLIIHFVFPPKNKKEL